jgi:hypothetical protein
MILSAIAAKLKRRSNDDFKGRQDCRAIGGQAAAATLGSASFAAKKRCPKLAPSVPL